MARYAYLCKYVVMKAVISHNPNIFMCF